MWILQREKIKLYLKKLEIVITKHSIVNIKQNNRMVNPNTNSLKNIFYQKIKT